MRDERAVAGREPVSGGAAASGPGEAVPVTRRLAHPPGDRYRAPAPEPVLERPATWRAVAVGAIAGLATATVMALVSAVLSMTTGLLAIAAVGGWLIGAGVRSGAWSGRPHRPSSMPGALAVALGIATWIAGLAGSWLVSMAILPGSSRTLPERIEATPFLDWLGPQLDFLVIVQLLLLAGVALVAAGSRSRSSTSG